MLQIIKRDENRNIAFLDSGWNSDNGYYIAFTKSSEGFITKYILCRYDGKYSSSFYWLNVGNFELMKSHQTCQLALEFMINEMNGNVYVTVDKTEVNNFMKLEKNKKMPV